MPMKVVEEEEGVEIEAKVDLATTKGVWLLKYMCWNFLITSELISPNVDRLRGVWICIFRVMV